MTPKRRATRRPAKRNGSPAVARLSALDLENVAQVELCRYFEIPSGIEDPFGTLPPRPRTRGGRPGLAPAARLFVHPGARARILFELDRLIRRARLQEGRARAATSRKRDMLRYSDSDAMDHAAGRKRLKRIVEAANPIPEPEPTLTRDSWRLWEAERQPTRETVARWARGASRRDVHAYILKRQRSVKHEIAALVARLKPKKRPKGRVFRLVYLPDQHSLNLKFTDSATSA